jgi:hypothetical protein
MATDALAGLNSLVKALEAGSYNAAPQDLVQGAALQTEDLSKTMYVTTFGNEHIKLQKGMKSESCKSLLAQFNRQLSYGEFGGSAVTEGEIGQEETSDYRRIVVPMAFYASMRKVTLQATLVATVDGTAPETRAAEDSAMKIAGDIEFDCFRGMADFSNAGVFDGNPLAISAMPNMHGFDLQVRQSDGQLNAQDAMFAEYGSSQSVVLPVGGNLTQDIVEDASLRSHLGFGDANMLYTSPTTVSAYNKIVFGKERIILAGSAQESTGGQLRKQYTAYGTPEVEGTNFLRGKYQAQGPRNTSGAPIAPTCPTTGTSTTVAGVVTAFVATNTYTYRFTAVNEIGESPYSVEDVVTVSTTGDAIEVVITTGGGSVRHYNAYRTAVGGAKGTERYIGRVVASTSGTTTTFFDLGNKNPAFVTGFLTQKDTYAMKELAPFSRVKLAQVQLATTEGFYRFCCLAMYEPRKNVILDNLV